MTSYKNVAGAVIYNADGEILLVHRSIKGEVRWETPGGKQEHGEELPATVVRELKEELGVDVSITKAIGKDTFKLNGAKWLYFWFEARITEGQTPIIRELDKFDGCAYWKVEDMRANIEDMSSNVRNLLKVLK